MRVIVFHAREEAADPDGRPFRGAPLFVCSQPKANKTAVCQRKGDRGADRDWHDVGWFLALPKDAEIDALEFWIRKNQSANPRADLRIAVLLAKTIDDIATADEVIHHRQDGFLATEVL